MQLKQLKLMNNISFILFLLVYSQTIQSQKFEPENGQCLVFIGQDLEATGGLDEYSDGYTDYFQTPAGVTVYSNLSPLNQSYGYYNQGLDGLKTKSNWGAGDSYANLYLRDSTYNNTAMAIGLSFVNNEKALAKGNYDHLIIELAQWIKSTNRPIFLRIGYEFDGWEWNHYKRRYYLKAWSRIHSILNRFKVDNVALVWQSKGYGSNQSTLEKWYPGDDLVDWVGYSYFGQPDQEMLRFARTHQKPVFIAEATPVRQLDNLYFKTDLNDQSLGQLIWKHWFMPFFETLEQHPDLIKAFSYINSDWASQPMWKSNPVFQKVDSRLQKSNYISNKWREKMKNPRYIKASTYQWKL